MKNFHTEYRNYIITQDKMESFHTASAQIELLRICAYDPNTISIRIMTYIWQSPHWPNFTHDPAIIAPHLAVAMRALGEVAGLRAGMNGDDLDELNRRRD